MSHDKSEPSLPGSSDAAVWDPSRRQVLKAGAMTPVAGSVLGKRSAARAFEATGSNESGPTVEIDSSINGEAFSLAVDVRASLLDLLRERLSLTGAKKGCDHGQCGACTVHIDGRRVLSCLTLAAKIDGCQVGTIEGLADGADLHPMQQAFIDHDALQCGYCTPGQIMAAVACVAEGHAETRDGIREYMSGNLCRCGAYVGIVAAIEQVAAAARKSKLG